MTTLYPNQPTPQFLKKYTRNVYNRVHQNALYANGQSADDTPIALQVRRIDWRLHSLFNHLFFWAESEKIFLWKNFFFFEKEKMRVKINIFAKWHERRQISKNNAIAQFSEVIKSSCYRPSEFLLLDRKKRERKKNSKNISKNCLVSSLEDVCNWK